MFSFFSVFSVSLLKYKFIKLVFKLKKLVIFVLFLFIVLKMNCFVIFVIFYFNFCTYGKTAVLPKAESLIGGYHSMNYRRSIFLIQEDFFDTFWHNFKFIHPSKCSGSFIARTTLITAKHCL